jgi:hypothetical protein
MQITRLREPTSKNTSLFIRDCPLQRASLRLRKCFGCPVCSVLKTNDVYQSNEVLPLARDIVEFINSDPELAKLGSLSVREP